MKSMKILTLAWAVMLSAAAYAQTTPPTQPTTTPQTQPTTPQSSVPQTPATTQQNSETFNKPESDRSINPVSVPLQQGGVIKDTIIPGQGRKTDGTNTPFGVDSSRMLNQKGSGELDTTNKTQTKKMRKNRKD